MFSIVEGTYQIKANGNLLANAVPGKIFYLMYTNQEIQLSDGKQNYGFYTHLEIEGEDAESVFQLKPVLPILPSADYDGNLTISISNDRLQLINQLELDKYISGVIEAEGGSNAMPEYYKAQAILIRTYAIRNMFRHAADGFNLCNTEHCQAYKGRSLLNRQILLATKSTDNLVLKNDTGTLIAAPYHSNCGGITSTAQMAWQTNLPCLQEIRDPFCSSGKNYSWTKQISFSTWKRYLEKFGIRTSEIQLKNYSFKSDNRQKYLTVNNIQIPTRKIREDLNLKSSFFSIENNGKELIFKGKGFGHGVGLCQEGAMEMARVGYTYVDILHFYFQQMNIAHVNSPTQFIDNPN